MFSSPGVELGAIEVNGKILSDKDKTKTAGEFWSGLGVLNALTASVSSSMTSAKLKVAVCDGATCASSIRSTADMSAELLPVDSYAMYSTFKVGDEASGWELEVGGADATNSKNIPTKSLIGDALTYHSGQKFATYDKDTSTNCARDYKGGWWYKTCHYSNVNGLFDTEGATGMSWYK